MSSNDPICQRCHSLYISKNKTNMCPKCLEERFLERGQEIKTLESQLQTAQAENAGLKSKLALAERALELVCEQVADNDCPHEYIWNQFQKPECENCTHMTEEHQDAGRDTKCWKEFFIQQAKAGEANES